MSKTGVSCRRLAIIGLTRSDIDFETLGQNNHKWRISHRPFRFDVEVRYRFCNAWKGQHATTKSEIYSSEHTCYSYGFYFESYKLRSLMSPWVTLGLKITRCESHIDRFYCNPCGKQPFMLPNEDAGKRNSRSGVSFRGTLRGCEYSIWATNARKITRH